MLKIFGVVVALLLAFPFVQTFLFDQSFEIEQKHIGFIIVFALVFRFVMKIANEYLEERGAKKAVHEYVKSQEEEEK